MEPIRPDFTNLVPELLALGPVEIVSEVLDRIAQQGLPFAVIGEINFSTAKTADDLVAAYHVSNHVRNGVAARLAGYLYPLGKRIDHAADASSAGFV